MTAVTGGLKILVNDRTCLVIDERGHLVKKAGEFTRYLQRPLEPNWIYLQNRYLQYTNVLCAAQELSALGEEQYTKAPFASLPTSFLELLDNELNPTEGIPDDLYPLKQRAQTGPHREFPLRSASDKTLSIKGPFELALGSITLAQALKEAYPGAVYYYMARPYRVARFDLRKGEIYYKPEKHWTTRPIAQAMVFPRFDNGILRLLRSESGFLAESELQVSERVLGFVERRGSTKTEHRYGPGSSFSQRELNRFFQTTGISWYFTEPSANTEALGSRIAEAFCAEFGVEPRDIGLGFFHSKLSPLGAGPCQGVCVFDATNGSLRLTERLGQCMPEVTRRAISLAKGRLEADLASSLETFALLVDDLHPVPASSPADVAIDGEGDWVMVIAPGEKAVFISPGGANEVDVRGHRYTPKGLCYELVPQKSLNLTAWVVPAKHVQPLHGETRMARLNLMTGEVEVLPPPGVSAVEVS